MEFCYDLNGKLVDANASALRIIGKSKLDDILGANIFHNIYLEQNKDKLIEEGSLKFQSKPLQNVIEKSLFNSNNPSIFIDWNVTISESGYLVQIQDITKYKNEEELLRTNEQKYQSFFEDDLTGDFIATPAGKILECNPSFIEVYNLGTREKALTKKISQFNQSDWNKITDMLKIDNKIKGHQSIHTRPDGTNIHVVANIVGIFNDSNELLQVKGYVFDDTERKKAEEKLANSKRQMKEILDSIHDGFIALSHYWHFIYVNHCAAEFFKVEYDDIIGQNICEMFPELINTTIEAKFREAMDTREFKHFEAHGLNNINMFDFSVYPSLDGISVYWKELKTGK